MLAIGSVLTGNGSPLTFATKHMHHHLYADTEKDIHSPVIDGALHAALLWPMGTQDYFLVKRISTPLLDHSGGGFFFYSQKLL